MILVIFESLGFRQSTLVEVSFHFEVIENVLYPRL